MSIADEHFAQLLLQTGSRYFMDRGPFCDLPEWGGWSAHIKRHLDDDAEQRRLNREFVRGQTRMRLAPNHSCPMCNARVTLYGLRIVDAFGSIHDCA